MTRLIAIISLALTLSVVGALGIVRDDGSRGSGASGVVGDPTAALTGADLEAVIGGLETRLDDVPGDAPGWATLAVAYVEQARVSGDASLYPLATDAIARSLEEQPRDNANALAAQAALAAARHSFTEALDYSRQALAIDPYQPGALAIRIDALTELGRFQAQSRALRQADRRQPGLPITTRYSYALELRGQLTGATAVLRRAGGVSTPDNTAFVETLLADLERRRGHLKRSAQHVRQALTAVPNHVPALASRARLALAQDRPQAALRLWEKVVRRLPLSDYLTTLGELELTLGRTEDAAQRFRIVTETNQAESDNGVNIDLEIALFEADHGSAPLALEAARAEWDRRHSIHVADALGWALHKNGQNQEALRYAREATQLGTEDARFWLHRGTIEATLGLNAAARDHLRRGLRIDPGLSPWLLDQGRIALRRLKQR